jgi:hypothetical protein
MKRKSSKDLLLFVLFGQVTSAKILALPFMVGKTDLPCAEHDDLSRG